MPICNVCGQPADGNYKGQDDTGQSVTVCRPCHEQHRAASHDGLDAVTYGAHGLVVTTASCTGIMAATGTAALAAIKLSGQADIGWVWVLSPIWITAALPPAALLIAYASLTCLGIATEITHRPRRPRK